MHPPLLNRGMLVSVSGLVCLFAGAGCALLPPQSLLDPTAVGMFPTRFREQGIRQALSPREGPLGLANADDPQPEDLVPIYEEYRIQANDVLALSIEDFLPSGLPYQVEREVSATGFIRVPQLGLIQVTGMTEQEIEEDLRIRVEEAGLLNDPVVQVVATVRRDRFFSVIGSVSRPGTYNLAQPDTRLLDVLGLVGDIGPEAKRLYVIRRLDGPSIDDAEADLPAGGDDGLIIPPPSNGDGFATGFTSASAPPRAAAVRQDPPQDSDDERAALEQIIAPPGMRTNDDSATQPADTRPAQRRFAPLVFDPVTGEMKESEGAAMPRSEPSEDDWEAPGEEEIDWETVPEYTLAQRVIEVDVSALRAGDPRYNLVIRNRDLVNVPVDIGVFYVMGQVARPGVYQFGGREITLKQAIATVGGFTALAWPSRCEIIRREAGTSKQIIYPVNLDRIFAGLEDDVLLRDNDIINVGTDVIAPFLFVIRNSFRFTYGFGFVYDRNFADKDSYGSKLNPQIREDQRRATLGLPF